MARLGREFGDRIDREKTIDFTFNSKLFSGLAGDTIASALAANGQWLVSRSLKYHRPRGILGLSGDDANILVQLADEPNASADLITLKQGLDVKPQNCNGSLENDPMAILGLFSRFLPVGFYYKTFFRPQGAWAFWSRIIRKTAGLGRIDRAYRANGYIESNGTHFDKQYLHPDTLVVGGGYHGMKAALAAAMAGDSVLLIEREPRLGGALNLDATKLVERDKLVDEIRATESIYVLTSTSCNGWYVDNWFAVYKEQRLYKVRAKNCVMAAGAMEQPAVFHNNDLPGIMLGSAAQRLIRQYAIRPGRKAVIIAGNDEAYQVALDVMDAGTSVEALVELRGQVPQQANVLAKRRVRIILDAEPHAAVSGNRHVKALQLRKRTAPHLEPRTDYEIVDTVACDLVCMSVGFMPAFQLPCQGGAKLVYDDQTATFAIENLPPGGSVVGAASGGWGLEKEEPSPNLPWPMFPHPKGKEFVDFDEDLTIQDLINAVHDGFDHIQLLKRYSTNGMGPSQGRQSALASARIVGFTTNKSISEIGITTVRPPLMGAPLALSAGRSFYPARRTAMHHWHEARGVLWLQAGKWYRPAAYQLDVNESPEICAARESLQVREKVGLIDISTLGGIDVRGPDAAEFVNRIYTGAFKRLKTGNSRYALFCNEAGVVIDDGVACRLKDQHFYLTATTVGVDRVVQQMFKWNAKWRLDVDIANVTSAYAAMNVAGPRARSVLSKMTDLHLTDSAFPYMAVREGKIAGVDARIIRTGFVGELGYEVHVPQHLALSVWVAMLEAGKPFDIEPFGVEAQRLLRLEKGHIIIGQDSDAITTPMELNMAWALAWGKPFFVGKRTLQDLESTEQKRRLVGFTIEATDSPMPKESHLLIDENQDSGIIGRVTSCAFSPVLSKIVGLALLEDLSRSSPGNRFVIRCDDGKLAHATVSKIPFYDPDNLRQQLGDAPAMDKEPEGKQQPAAARAESLVSISVAATTSATSPLSMFDKSLVSRQGFKGAGAIEFLLSHGVDVPDTPNKAKMSRQGSLIARLSYEEILLLSADAATDSLAPTPNTALVYPLPRSHSHCCFQLIGSAANEALSKLTAINLGRHHFQNLDIAQTSIAGINGILIRKDLDSETSFYVLADSPFAEYLWHCLQDAIAEFNGG